MQRHGSVDGFTLQAGNSWARVTEWQTWWTQNPLSERACGFESRPGHAGLPRLARIALTGTTVVLVDGSLEGLRLPDGPVTVDPGAAQKPNLSDL